MKNPCIARATRSSLLSSAASTRYVASLVAGSAAIGGSVAYAVDWDGSESSDWNTAGNWVGDAVPAGDVATISTESPNVATISADVTEVPTEIQVGRAALTGRLDHTAGSISNTANSSLVVGGGGDGSMGTYNLCDTSSAGAGITGFAQGSGSAVIGGAPTDNGNLLVGDSANSMGTVNINTSGTLVITNDIFVGRGNATSVGVLNLESGSVTAGAMGNGCWCAFGREGGNGTLNMTGGTLVSWGSIYAARDVGSVGAINFSDGRIECRDGEIVVGGGGGGDGVMNVDGGSIETYGREMWIANGQSGDATPVRSMGEFNLTAGTVTVDNWVAVGRDNGIGVWNQTGGTFIKTGGGSFTIGTIGIGDGTVNHSGGLIDIQSGNFIVGEGGQIGTYTISDSAMLQVVGDLEVARGGGCTGVVNFDGGTASFATLNGGAGTTTVNFNGTQITATQDRPDFMNEIMTANLGDGGMLVDTDGHVVGSSIPLTGTGGIVKSGSGTLNLVSGLVNHDYTGETVVDAGMLVLPADPIGFSDSPGDITVNDGAGLGVTAQVAGDQLVPTNVTFDGATTGTTLAANVGDISGMLPGDPLLNVSGTLTINGQLTINVTGENLVVGSFPLIGYSGALAGTSPSFVIGTLPDGVEANVSDDGSGTVSLNITSVEQAIWNGSDTAVVGPITADILQDDAIVLIEDAVASGIVVGQTVSGVGIPAGTTVVSISSGSPDEVTLSQNATETNPTAELTFSTLPGSNDGVWDVETTQNWIDNATNAPRTYQNGLPVVFDDSALVTDIVLDAAVTPTSVIFANDGVEYSVSGSGGIGGSIGVQKQGGGAVAMSLTNTYTGATVIGGGTYTVPVLNAAETAGPLGAATNDLGNLELAGGFLGYTGATTTFDRNLLITGTGSGIDVGDNDVTLTGQIQAEGPASSFGKGGSGDLTIPTEGTNSYSSGTGNPGFTSNGGVLTFTGGGTHNVANDIWTGTVPGVPSDVVFSNTTFAATGWLAAQRGNGIAGSETVGNVTATGSTVQTGNFSTGYANGLPDNDVHTNITLTNSTWTNTGVALIAENGGSTANWLIEGTSVFNCDRLQMALGAGSVVDVVIQDSGSINKTGGAWLSIGNSNDGVGTVTVKDSGSLINAAGDFNVSDVDSSVGVLNVQDNGTVTSGGNVFIGKGANTHGTLNLTGGSFSAGAWMSIGRYGATSLGDVNVTAGTLAQTGGGQALIVGEEGIGNLNVSGTGVVTIAGELRVGQADTSTGTVNLGAGGTITAPRVYEVNAPATSAFNFDGGVLIASASREDYMVVDAVTLNAGGGTINTGENNVGIPSSIGGSGALTKVGTGTLTLAGTNGYAGGTNINEGTLSTTTETAFADTSTVVVAAGATLDLNHAGNEIVSGLTINGAPLADGTYDSTHPSGQITGTGSITVGFVATPFDLWIANYYPGETDPLVIGLDADPDGDGQSNKVEFALGGVPNDASDNAKVYVLTSDTDTDTMDELVITAAVRDGGDGAGGDPVFAGAPSPSATVDGCTITVQGSENLGSFDSAVSVVATPVDGDLPTAPDGYEYRTFSLDASNGLPSAGFLRVDVAP